MNHTTYINKQQGITLIGAIFILIIVSLLGKYLISIAGVQRQISIMTLQSSRAYQAANAGLEWGIADVTTNHTCPASPPTNFSNLAGFTVTISCNDLGDFNENGDITTIYQLQATAEFSAYDQIDYVSRSLETVIHD